MPELPEVETVVQSIRHKLIGNEFEKIEVRWPKVLFNFSKSDFLNNLVKRKIERVDRRAKFIIIGFNKGILAIHLRMTGKLYLQNNISQKKHISAIITMNNDNYLIFEDTRKFGKFYYYKSQNYLNNKLGIEPLSNDMNDRFLLNILHNKKRMIKALLLDQHIIAGLEYMSPKNMFYRLELYQKNFEHLLTLKQDGFNSIEGTSSDSSTANEFWDTKGNSWGAEILIKKSSGRLNGWIGYTYAETQYFTEPSGWHYPNFDRTHTLNIVSSFEMTKDLEINAALTNSSGNPYTKILGRAYDWKQNLNSNTFWYPLDSYIVGEKNTERYDDYFRIDVGMIRKGGNLFGLEYDTFWQIMNLTRHLNILTYQYRTETDPLTGNQLGVERRATPMFPLIFTFGVKFEF